MPARDVALNALSRAAGSLAEARRTHSVEAIARADATVRTAVEAARALDVPWGVIGNALGIARGNAYQRYRHKPSLLTALVRRDAPPL